MARKFVCEPGYPVAETRAGKLRGFELDGICCFHGIKYGTAERFLPPVPVEPWEGVRDANTYGPVAPLISPPRAGGELRCPHRFWPESEDCLSLNVWTPALDAGARKPVLFWMHGGGFGSGSSIEQIAYEGYNSAKYGDVVLVSVNHRLNIFGYFNLADFGERFKNSGNAGMEDLVLALTWVRENIAAFGGDPENVTIFGQSGGGGKVTTLLQTPAADGLFQKAIIESGVMDGGPSTDAGSGKAIAEAMLAYLGESDIEALRSISTAKLLETFNAVSYGLHEKGVSVDWAPTANGWYVGEPRTVGFREHALTVPTMVGTVLAEFGFAPLPPNKDSIPEAERAALLQKKYGEAAPELTALFKKAYPGKNSIDLLNLDSICRKATIDYLDVRAKGRGDNVYSFLFALDFPLDGGVPAWHCSELPFVFHNTELVPIANIPGVTDKLEEQMFGAWVAFARSGDPNHEGLPRWPAWGDGCGTMVFDRDCELRYDYDRELMALHKKVAPPMFIKPFAPKKK